jgi:diacylglycerol kinase family enzyme
MAGMIARAQGSISAMRVHGIINKKAGALIGTDPELFIGKLKAAFTEAGHELTLETVEPEAICDRLEAAAGRSFDAILVGGGDGSVNAAARMLLGGKTALGILPLGTLNRLARELGLSVELDQVATQLAQAEPVRIDVAEVNGEIFLCNSFIGLPPMVSEVRQSLRGRGFFERMAGYLRLPLDISRNMRRLTLLIDDREAPRIVRALTVVVSNNAYSEEPNLLPKRRALDEGKLGLYISQHYTFWQTAWLLIRASLGLWRGDPRLEMQELHKLTITSKKGHLRVANDGELLKLDTPLHYSIRPKALTVLTPAGNAA